MPEGYKVDGFLEANQNQSSSFKGTVFEFHGCYLHGCPRCFENNYDTRTVFDRPMRKQFEKTREKMDHIRRSNYRVEEIWECDFKRLKESQPEISEYLKNHPRLTTVKLDPRDAFFGGRTENFVTNYKINDNEKIKYTDICSLYPFICKTGKFPLGHPEIYVKQECLELTGAQYENFYTVNGLVKCTILPPRNLYIPVLPVKMRGKLIFPLCRSCCEEENFDECYHEDIESRALSGTWVSDEVAKALEKGYRLLSVDVI